MASDDGARAAGRRIDAMLSLSLRTDIDNQHSARAPAQPLHYVFFSSGDGLRRSAAVWASLSSRGNRSAASPAPRTACLDPFCGSTQGCYTCVDAWIGGSSAE